MGVQGIGGWWVWQQAGGEGWHPQQRRRRWCAEVCSAMQVGVEGEEEGVEGGGGGRGTQRRVHLCGEDSSGEGTTQNSLAGSSSAGVQKAEKAERGRESERGCRRDGEGAFRGEREEGVCRWMEEAGVCGRAA